MKHPLIIADSHGVYFSAVFGQLKDPWEADGTSPIQITKDGCKVGDYYVLNARSLFFVRIETEQGSVIDIHPQMKPMILAEMNSYDHCLISIDGNVHMANFMCKNGPTFDFYEPNTPYFIDENRQIVPSWSLEKFLMRGREVLAGKLQALKRLLVDLPIHFLAPPLPIPSDAQIHGESEIFNFSVQELEHPYFRLKIYHAYCRCLEAVCNEVGVSYVPPNKLAADSDGFLLEEYWQGATHAKTDYYSFLNRDKN